MFIRDTLAISPQKTFSKEFESGELVTYTGNKLFAIEPNYQTLIPLAQLRRMGKSVKMGLAASIPLIIKNEKPDGIIIGTANGGSENCIQFLNQIIQYKEDTLTPTHFVQSTSNALAGQIAIMSKITGYNSTHVNSSFAFENALIDGIMHFELNSDIKKMLIGAVDEISEHNFNIDHHANRFKVESLNSQDVIYSKTAGTICGEGANMFIMDKDPSNALGKIIGVEICQESNADKLSDFVDYFIKKYELRQNEIDTLVLGRNGDVRHDYWYDFIKNKFNNAQYIYYKNFCGEYRTAAAFGLYLLVKIMNGGELQNVLGNWQQTPKISLLYNQFEGSRHGFILVGQVNK